MKFYKKPLNMHLISVFILLFAFISIFLSGMEMRKVNSCIDAQNQIENSRRQCEEESQALTDASDYLTTEVWHFIATQDVDYLRDYWREVDEWKSRDAVMSRLSELSLTEEESSLIQAAKQESDSLINGEAWAMRLIAESIGMSLEDMPPAVAAIVFRNGEEDLTLTGKKDLAIEYIFGDDYTASKKIIYQNIKDFRTALNTRMSMELSEATRQTESALRLLQFYDAVILLLLIGGILSFYLLVLHPFHRYAVSLSRLSDEDTEPLIPSGSRETIAFANAFNQIYADWKRQREELEKERLRFHVVVENTNLIIFEYDPSADLYSAYGVLNGSSGATAPMERTINSFIGKAVKEVVDPEFQESMKEMFLSVQPQEQDLRLLPYVGGSNYVWARVTSTPILDSNGNVSKVVGKIINIESEKQKEFALEEMKSRDSLTGLYNKTAGIRMVQQYMAHKSPKDICGMMLLDMDNFQSINQQEGAAFADAVLQEVADILRSNTGADDILVRLGGDEFMLFIKNCPKSRATLLGPHIAEEIRELSIAKSDGLQISASIGMCVTEVVDEYSGLYRCAESTLKYVKENGKEKAACYLDTSNELGTMLTQLYTEKHFINEIDRPSNYQREDIISFALELLGKSKKLDDSVSLLLARIGKHYQADRVSIMDIDPDYLSLRFSYQWAVNTCDLRLEQKYYIKQEELSALSGAYDAEGLCDHYILSSHPEISSCLHASILNQGVYVGAVCLEKWEADYQWDEEDRRLLTEITRIISSFLLKAQADAVSQAKTDFLSRMSHEIRTPMNAITGITAIAKTVLDDREKTLECLETIDSANSYLLNLINDILDMSRIESGKVELNPESINMQRHIDNLETMMRPQAETKQLSLVFQNNISLSRNVLADGMRLNQVLINLIGNALKFTHPGGRITVTAEKKMETESSVQIYLSVKDNGIGISKSAIKRIFNVFEQAEKDTSNTFGGTGLGLTISSRLVQMMGGILEVSSEVDVGSDFYFTLELPFAEGLTDSEPAEDTVEACHEYHFEGKRILLVEDNELNRSIAETILQMNQFEVESAVDGRDAIEHFKRNAPYYYDAILMDIRMPVMNGLEATKRIRTLDKEDSRTIPIIAMTANAFDEDMKKSLESGMNGHLSKPIEVDRLMETLWKCLPHDQAGPDTGA